MSPLPLREVVTALERLYPPHTASPWDRVGLVSGDLDQPVSLVHFAVDPTLAVIDEARIAGADLLVTHHPLLLRGVHAVATSSAKGAAVTALIVNRMHPDPGGGTAKAARLRAETFAGTDLGDLFTALADLTQMAEGEAPLLSSLTERIQPAPVCRVPFLPFEVSDLNTLGRFADALFAEDPFAISYS